MHATVVNPATCPLSSALGFVKGALHDLRPSLQAWAGVWTIRTADAVHATEDRAILIVHLGGSPINARLGDAIDRDVHLVAGGCLAITGGMPFRMFPEGEARILGLVFDEALVRMSAIPLLARVPGHYELMAGAVPPPNPLASIAGSLAGEVERDDSTRCACRAALMLAMIEFIAADSRLTRCSEALTPLVEVGIQRVIQLIDDNISLELPLEWLAREAGISPYHLSRNFRRAMGVGLQDYTRRRRMEAACRLLAGTRKPLAEIAYDCGFSSQSRMNGVFRQLLDTTPLEYRKACWKVNG